MSKITLFIASSLDGFIARENGEIDWLFTDADYGYTEFYDSIDTIMMGRKTYEQILTFPEYPYPGKTAYVFHRSPHLYNHPDVIFINQNLLDFVPNIIPNSKGIWLVGGGEIFHEFLKLNLIDEIILSIHPIILGTGIRLFLNSPDQINLKLNASQKYDSGLVQIHYTVMK
ncbi:dihydrofolate reductase family protein [Calothrix sp. 336/3]|uniref:dihydrofolate reductase family protein n=1 Tax=Calothrix sp. 336/3 TaxID=1337936 RepID=UPI0004E2BD96|nr:dihydrofolate reductase family protein [Calothrix sp. 336/3]AKG23537.1 riboflavin biosynthesis protein RibD [Calothrix sp. 336/3]